MFAWYWLADLCETERIPFVLGHALYMKAIHGGKAKNDRIDAAKIAGLLRGGMFPMAYVYPQGQARDPRPAAPPQLLRPPAGATDRPHRQNTNSQYNLPPFDEEAHLRRQPHRRHRRALRRTRAPGSAIAADLALIDGYDEQIADAGTAPGEDRQGR